MPNNYRTNNLNENLDSKQEFNYFSIIIAIIFSKTERNNNVCKTLSTKHTINFQSIVSFIT